MNEKIKKWLYPTIAAIIFIGIWEAAVRSFNFFEFILPQ